MNILVELINKSLEYNVKLVFVDVIKMSYSSMAYCIMLHKISPCSSLPSFFGPLSMYGRKEEIYGIIYICICIE